MAFVVWQICHCCTILDLKMIKLDSLLIQKISVLFILIILLLIVACTAY